MQRAVWINPGINTPRVTGRERTVAAERDPTSSQIHDVAKSISVVPGRVGKRELRALGIQPYAKDDQNIATKTGKDSYISPGPGSRTRGAAQETRTFLSSYFQSKVKRKQSKNRREFETEWDLALSPDAVKRNLFDDREFDEEISFRPETDRDPRPRTEQVQAELTEHWERMKSDLREGLSPQVHDFCDNIPDLSSEEEEFELKHRFLVRDVPDGAEDCETPEGSQASSPSFEIINGSSGGSSSFEQIDAPDKLDLISFDSDEDLDEVHEAHLLDQFLDFDTSMTAMSKDTAEELTKALKGLTEMVQPGRDKDLTEALKGLASAVKAERADKDPSFKLEHFQYGRTDPYIWWERLEKHAKAKGTAVKDLFSLVVDDVTHAWFTSVKGNITEQELKDAFLLEFGEEGAKVWDKQKDLQDMTQGTLSAKDFVRQVLAKARRCFGVKAHEEFRDEHKNVIMSVLVNGFSPRVKALVLTRKAETLDDIMKAANDAKCLEETPSTDTVMLAMETKFQELMMPMVSKIDSVHDKLESRGEDARKVGKPHVRWRSPPTSAESSRESSPVRLKPQKKSFKDAKTSPNTSRPPTPVADLECYYCGNRGHTKAKCALWIKRQKEEASKTSATESDSKSQTIICYDCKEEGHVRRTCPKRRQKKNVAPCQICGGKDHKAAKCPERHKQD